MARAWLALDAADAAGLPAALERALWTLARIGEVALSRSFEVWCDGALRPRFGDRMGRRLQEIRYYVGASSRTVTGPSFTSATCMSAPNSPVRTAMPRSSKPRT